MFHDGRLVLGRFVVASSEHRDDFAISLCLCDLSSVAVGHAFYENLSELFETWVGAQQCSESFD